MMILSLSPIVVSLVLLASDVGVGVGAANLNLHHQRRDVPLRIPLLRREQTRDKDWFINAAEHLRYKYGFKNTSELVSLLATRKRASGPNGMQITDQVWSLSLVVVVVG
jgi:hypothetical protein